MPEARLERTRKAYECVVVKTEQRYQVLVGDIWIDADEYVASGGKIDPQHMPSVRILYA